MKQVRAPGGLGSGALGGLVGISCCVSPVVLYLVGVASATEAVALGNRWYTLGTSVAPASSSVVVRSRCTCDGATSAIYAAPARSGGRSPLRPSSVS